MRIIKSDDGMKWETSLCTKQSYFVCKKRARNRVYKAVNKKVIYSLAKQNCINWGGTLADVTSNKEEKYIRDFATEG
jgi:hypothetical protein